jgi:hypothetical protein
MDLRAEIREFLSSRRSRISPEQAGLPAYGGNRRVKGLRREEVAMLAGVSVDYYVRMERGSLAGVLGERSRRFSLGAAARRGRARPPLSTRYQANRAWPRDGRPCRSRYRQGLPMVRGLGVRRLLAADQGVDLGALPRTPGLGGGEHPG